MEPQSRSNLTNTLNELSIIMMSGNDKEIIAFIESMIRRGIDINSDFGDYFFTSSLLGHMCLHRNASSKVIEHLLNVGANPNGIAGERDPPIIGAIIRGELHIIEILLKRGARLDNVVDSNKYDPMFNLIYSFSTTEKTMQIFELLVKYGLDYNYTRIVNGYKQNAISYAIDLGEKILVDKLSSLGCIPVKISPDYDTYYDKKIEVIVSDNIRYERRCVCGM